MFGSVVLDVAIGLIFVYLLVSLMVTSVTELTSGLLKSRAKNLWRGLHHLLDSGAARTWVDQLYDHPLIDSLGSPAKPANGKPAEAARAKVPRHGPSYIPSRTFAVALIEILREPQRALQMEIDRIPDDASLKDVQKHLTDWVQALPDEGTPWKAQAAKWIASLPPSASTVAAKRWLRSLSLQDVIDNLRDDPNDKLKKHLLALYDEARGDVEEFKKNTEIWFNNSMDRVSGWYKRRTQIFNFAAAAVLVIFLNVDTVLIVHALSENQALRETLVTQAEAYTESEDAPAATSAGGAVQSGRLGVDQSRVVGGDEVKGTITLATAAEADQTFELESGGPEVVPPPPVTVLAGQTTAQFPVSTQPVTVPKTVSLAIKGSTADSVVLAVQVSPAEQFRALRGQIGALGLPIGWSMEPNQQNEDYRQFPGLDLNLWGSTLVFHLLGWIISMFAVSLGAPFWFDMLNKVISIRSSGRAPEEKPKSPEKVPQPREPGNVPATTDQNKVIVEVVHSAGGAPAP